jgi:PQQ-dependent catabolism-associated CXXCW motif protein
MGSSRATAAMIARRGLALALALLAIAAAARADEGGPADFDPGTGYRIARYRSPVPAQVPGGARVGVDDIDRLKSEKNAILLDVMPSDGAGLDLATGQWSTKRHDNIPGSTWLPDVGRGRVTPELQRYLEDNLGRLTAGDKGRAIIIYCQSDCWMGWNAVQRIAAIGYTALYWYPDGIDGWRDWDRDFAPATPVPLKP